MRGCAARGFTTTGTVALPAIGSAGIGAPSGAAGCGTIRTILAVARTVVAAVRRCAVTGRTGPAVFRPVFPGLATSCVRLSETAAVTTGCIAARPFALRANTGRTIATRLVKPALALRAGILRTITSGTVTAWLVETAFAVWAIDARLATMIAPRLIAARAITPWLVAAWLIRARAIEAALALRTVTLGAPPLRTAALWAPTAFGSARGASAGFHRTRGIAVMPGGCGALCWHVAALRNATAATFKVRAIFVVARTFGWNGRQ